MELEKLMPDEITEPALLTTNEIARVEERAMRIEEMEAME